MTLGTAIFFRAGSAFRLKDLRAIAFFVGLVFETALCFVDVFADVVLGAAFVGRELSRLAGFFAATARFADGLEDARFGVRLLTEVLAEELLLPDVLLKPFVTGLLIEDLKRVAAARMSAEISREINTVTLVNQRVKGSCGLFDWPISSQFIAVD